MALKTISSLLLLSVMLTLSAAANAGKLYRWVDESGNYSFSDKVPPKYARKEHTQLSEAGRTIEVKDAAKTAEQLALLKKINALQKTQQKLLTAQLAKDAALLKTFQSTEDIDALAHSKSEMVQSHIVIASGQSATLKKQLILYQSVAANFERKGKKIPQKSLDNIASARSQFDKNQREISEFEAQKKHLGEQLLRDKARFEVLSKQGSEKPSIQRGTIPSLVLGELPCSAKNCERLWEKAQQFIQQQNAVVIYSSDDLLLTKKPKLGKDRGLSLTKLQQSGQTTIMLDIRCADSPIGKRTCKDVVNRQLSESFQQLRL